MKKTLFILGLVCNNLVAQNIVPNSAFTNYSTCPTSQNELYLAYPWYNPSVFPSTPDFWHTCMNIVPNYPGVYYQNDHSLSGGGFGGIGTFLAFTTNPNSREYLQVELTDTLHSGSKYCVEFYASLVESSGIAISDLGIYFSDTAMFQTINLPFSVSPQIENPDTNFLNDKVNWMRIFAIYSAHGGEKFITLGNFRDSVASHAILMDSNAFQNSYYLIDDVSVINCDSLFIGLPEQSLSNSINLYPNPATDVLTITNNDKILSVAILNILGCSVLENKDNLQNKLTLNISSLSKGIYFASITTTRGMVVKKFVKQ